MFCGEGGNTADSVLEQRSEALVEHHPSPLIIQMAFCGMIKRLGSAVSVDRRVAVSPSYYSFDVLVVVAL